MYLRRYMTGISVRYASDDLRCPVIDELLYVYACTLCIYDLECPWGVKSALSKGGKM